jgi:hypothetical protein
LVAEEQVDPDLMAYDKDGKPFSVPYDQVSAQLELNKPAPQTVWNTQ